MAKRGSSRGDGQHDCDNAFASAHGSASFTARPLPSCTFAALCLVIQIKHCAANPDRFD
jgi:hypothetical protein